MPVLAAGGIMNYEDLASLIERPEVHEQILGDYSGSYTLGITRNPGDRDQAALLLRVEGEEQATSAFPRQIFVKGHAIPVIVKHGFRQPTAVPCAMLKVG